MRYLITLLALLGCSNKVQYQKRPSSQFYVSSEVGRYYLAELPTWSNFSQAGACQRDKQVRYLNFKAVYDSFGLKHHELTQIQYRVNQLLELAKKNNRSNQLSVAMNEKFFFQARDEVKGGILPFMEPRIKKIHLIWIDPALSDKSYEKKLNRLLKSDEFLSGHPVFISDCLTQNSLKEFSKRYGLGDADVKMITPELFTSFNNEFENSRDFRVHLDGIFNKKEVVLYMIKKMKPKVFGTYKLKRI